MSFHRARFCNVTSFTDTSLVTGVMTGPGHCHCDTFLSAASPDRESAVGDFREKHAGCMSDNGTPTKVVRTSSMAGP